MWLADYLYRRAMVGNGLLRAGLPCVRVHRRNTLANSPCPQWTASFARPAAAATCPTVPTDISPARLSPTATIRTLPTYPGVPALSGTPPEEASSKPASPQITQSHGIGPNAGAVKKQYGNPHCAAGRFTSDRPASSPVPATHRTFTSTVKTFPSQDPECS